MSEKYILDEQGNPVVEHDLIKWAKWFEVADFHVADDTVDDARVSTVFIGFNKFGEGAPILFETMIFGGTHDGYQECYTNRVAALAGHDRAMALVMDSWD